MEFIQSANDRREVTSEGFTFLDIPRSYYGVLTAKLLTTKVDGVTPLLSGADAGTVFESCVAGGVCDEAGAVDLALSTSDIASTVSNFSGLVTGDVIDVIAFSR